MALSSTVAASTNAANAHPYDYEAHSRIAGPLQDAPETDYTVRFKGVMKPRDAFKALVFVVLNLGIEITFLIWLFLGGHISVTDSQAMNVATIVIVACIAIIELFRLINVFTLCLATLLARDPIPVQPESGLRVAFTTTIVPSKEPFDVVAKTLQKMLEVRHDGTIDVWLLDEGNDREIKKACKKMGVRHFTRKNIAKWNTPKGQFKAKSKHGNHNAWLDKNQAKYDIVVSVDPDHVPLPNFCERILGYFRDPNIAFVVGPQVYGNYNETFVTRGAESQAYLFQATIQRAGNAYNAAMFVGTNHAYRVSAWKTIGGFQDSITEDMLTSLKVHSTKNPETKKYWKSVYTPDVLAIGEGPTSWTDFFTQQLRWSRGSNEILVKKYWWLAFKLTAGKRLHYSLMMAYYPAVAVSWAIGILLAALFLVFGLEGVHIPGGIWLAFYLDVAVAQAALYIWLRKYNVSPHEDKASSGALGMFMSMVTAPIYLTALKGALLRQKLHFVVTPKGESSSPDSWRTFSKHIAWAIIAFGSIILSFAMSNRVPGVRIWSVLTIIVSLAPLAVWLLTKDSSGQRSALIIKLNKFASVQKEAS